jgi:arylsulfatase
MFAKPAAVGAAILLAAALSASPLSSQVVTGTPGSPHGTTTISGMRLPPPDFRFGGVIQQAAPQSTTWWAPRVVPPQTD